MIFLANILNDQGHRTKFRITRRGNNYGGKRFGVTQIQHLLKNVLYIGKVKYAGQIYDGQQPAIVDEETFKQTQHKLAENRVKRRAIKNADCSGLLTHLLKCKACGKMMTHTYTLKKGNHKYRYYVCTSAQKHGYNSCPNKSINAQTAEEEVVRHLQNTLDNNKSKYINGLKTEIEVLLSPVWETLFFEEKHRIMKTLLKEVDCDVPSKKIGLTFNESGIRLELEADVKKARPLIRWKKEKEVAKEPKIRNLLVLAHQIQRLCDKGRIQSSQQAAQWLNISESRFDHILSLLYLSPAIQTEILTGRDEILSIIPEYKVRSMAAEINWQKQVNLWQEIKQTISQQ